MLTAALALSNPHLCRSAWAGLQPARSEHRRGGVLDPSLRGLVSEKRWTLEPATGAPGGRPHRRSGRLSQRWEPDPRKDGAPLPRTRGEASNENQGTRQLGGGPPASGNRTGGPRGCSRAARGRTRAFTRFPAPAARPGCLRGSGCGAGTCSSLRPVLPKQPRRGAQDLRGRRPHPLPT